MLPNRDSRTEMGPEKRMEVLQEAVSLLNAVMAELQKSVVRPEYHHFSNPIFADLPDYPWDGCKLVWHDGFGAVRDAVPEDVGFILRGIEEVKMKAAVDE